jgi:hypothetical protein
MELLPRSRIVVTHERPWTVNVLCTICARLPVLPALSMSGGVSCRRALHLCTASSRRIRQSLLQKEHQHLTNRERVGKSEGGAPTPDQLHMRAG